MIAVIAEVTVKAGAGAEFEAVVADLIEQIKANEPGNLTYQLVRSRTDAEHYRFFELYADDAAVEAHGRSDHFRAAGKLMAPLLAGAPKIEYFTAV
ncbi:MULTISPECIES: putative quinol monooxygenase [Nocardia]|uniref:putative quinol monooxygenase n=1 Tax=Nocardia TaxID=1817 RepID=UPI0007004161|nr:MULTISPECIES: putative quinol monooxygenase [Nocardia]KQY37437.1 antibiotic biosynthesis monooxygenase [Nocardia sp. Root136]WKG06980.1 putative quinol monooxygenase [Nocardia sp. PE-7]